MGQACLCIHEVLGGRVPLSCGHRSGSTSEEEALAVLIVLHTT